MRIQCAVYKSLRHTDYYLYVATGEDLARVPDGLKQMLGRVEKVLELELSTARELAQADVREVLKQIEKEGYYLQMPPRGRSDGLAG